MIADGGKVEVALSKAEVALNCNLAIHNFVAMMNNCPSLIF